MTLEERVNTLTREQLEKFYIQELKDWAETDTHVRDRAKEVLTEYEVDGDSYGVPAIEDIVDLLVMRLKEVMPR